MNEMLKIFRSETVRLGREESGVALMLTLSVILLLYVLCAGVYSVGETVRQKIELQNAVDAAAYSAAVVEADGLSRMALVNRAMAWTYIQLVNMQIDCITYRWLELVAKRFKEDRDMCEHHNAGTRFPSGDIPIFWPLLDRQCRPNLRLRDPGIGWFCGVAGKGMDMVRLNRMGSSDDPVPMSEIHDVLSDADIAGAIAQYEKLIPAFKTRIGAYSAMLPEIASRMQESIPATALATLYYNLPRKADKGEIDGELAGDFLGYADFKYIANPYFKVETDDGETVGGIFSPLYNTELDERIFLSMAGGRARFSDNLIDCFGKSGDEKRRCGGLDQWFIRSYPDEPFRPEPKFTHALPQDEYDPNNSLKALGICRVYKHANRTHLGGDIGAYRANHRGLDDDDMPSCANTHALCPEQCGKAADSIALYADYEWSSGRYTLTCTHVHCQRPKGGEYHLPEHYHRYEADFIGQCRKHASLSLGTHTREEYMSCWAQSNRLRIPKTRMAWPSFMILECFGDVRLIGQFLSFLTPVAQLLGIPSVSNDGNYYNLPPGWSLTQGLARWANFYDPKGFARIYGDDKDLINDPVKKESYAGVPAKPWILNSSYYDGGGTITVGLARKQRNPWTMLLNAVNEVFAQDRCNEDGVYSAFDPVQGGYMVAFASARAGHLAGNDPGEYETRYDAVCDDLDEAHKRFGDGDPNYKRRFRIQSTEELCKARIGCVCDDAENAERFSRCWNLCETDWDATLLPVRYADSSLASEWWDSYANTLSGDRRINAAIWKEEIENLDDSVLVDAARRKWVHLVGGSGEMSGSDIMLMREPMTTLEHGVKRIEAPYTTFDTKKTYRVNGPRAVDPARMIYYKVL